MAKANTVSRLLRNLARAGKAQRKLISTLVATTKPKAVKRSSALVRKAQNRAPGTLDIRQHGRPEVTPAPGKWIGGHVPYPQQPQGPNLLRMNYWLYLPEHTPGTAARQGWPLIVMLHGCHQSATQFAKATRMNHLAEAKGYAVLYPQQPLSAQSQRCWRWYNPSVQGGSGETAALAALIKQIAADQQIDRRRIYACGISAGAGMASILALNHPELIAAIGLHSGPVFGAGSNAVEGLRVMRHGSTTPAHLAINRRPAHHELPMPALFIQGDEDTVVRPVNQHQLTQQWLKLNGRSRGMTADRVTTKPRGRGNSRNACEIRDYLLGRKPLVRAVLISGLGHAWSGGDPSERFTSKAGPDASRMMIDFFSKHRR